jgi:hypothetical protein
MAFALNLEGWLVSIHLWIRPPKPRDKCRLREDGSLQNYVTFEPHPIYPGGVAEDSPDSNGALEKLHASMKRKGSGVTRRPGGFQGSPRTATLRLVNS